MMQVNDQQHCRATRFPAWPSPPSVVAACLLVVLGFLATGCDSSSSSSASADPSAPVDRTLAEPEQAEPEQAEPEQAEPEQAEPDESTPVQPLPREADNGAPEKPLDRRALIARSAELAASQDFAAAAAVLRNLLVVDPSDAEVVFRLANLTAASGDLPQAISLLEGIPDDHPEAGLPAIGQSAEWYFQLEQYEQAEQRYLKVLELVPQAAPALRQLAYILNRQGRRHEAAVYIRQLCELGDVRQDELHSLISLSDAMYDPPSAADSIAEGSRPYWPIGTLAEARKQFNAEGFRKVTELLHDSVADGVARPAAVALYGLAAAESQDDSRLRWWLAKTDDATRRFPEYWTAIGIHQLNLQQPQQAARAFAEAITLDPTDLRAISRLRQTLLALNQDAMAERYVQRWNRVRESILINNRIAATRSPDLAAISDLADQLSDLDRPLEALLWRAIKQHYDNAPNSERLELNQQREQLVVSGQMFPSLQQRLCGLDKQQFPLPELDLAKETEPAIAAQQAEQATPASFENVAVQTGIRHSYRVATQPVQRGFTVYQMLGGGVVVFDYDLDGQCDLYFAQGGADPPTFHGDQSNQLYRHIGSTLVETTAPAQAAELQYTIGVTAGDWNQDGFPDLAIANIGADVLLINNGDGTFAARSLTTTVNLNRVPSSLAIADLTGDGLPDLYQASYVDDSRMTMKPPANDQGQPLQPILPSKFDAAADRLVVNDSKGGFSSRPVTPNSAADSTSLGLIVTDFDDRPGTEVFVANDMKPNQLWTRSASGEWADVAPARGCAFSYTGASTAAMGVAAGDLTGNGAIDLHITNYEREHVSLFLNRNGAFQDRSIQYRLSEPSHVVLGFGTQAIDYDNNGRRDLVVANGHIEDAVENTTPLKQPAQLFCNLGSHFQIADVNDPTGYWSVPHVGRAVALLDFDSDGRQDFVVSHLEEPSALLLNRTPNDHHWLQLQLVGTRSERDAIGARIRVRVGEQVMTDWVIAGNGYLCHNESVVHFGLGANEQIDEIEVTWPNGDQQVFPNPPVDRRILLIESQTASPFPTHK